MSEYKTSSKYPRCSSENTTAKRETLQMPGLWARGDRDAVGVLNVGCIHGGSVNGVWPASEAGWDEVEA